MTDHDNSQGEPTMEEILASIRRIISEDNDDSEGPAAKPEVKDAAKEAPNEPAARREAEVLELSPAQMVHDGKPEGEAKPNGFDRVGSGPAPRPSHEAAQEEIPAGGTERASESSSASEVEETLLSPEVATAAAAAFGALSKDVRVSRGSETRSLEELVKEMMKPLLKEWLDENLPPLVEDVVEREVRRLSHRRVRR